MQLIEPSHGGNDLKGVAFDSTDRCESRPRPSDVVAPPKRLKASHDE
ncbi:hypothetical protein OG948_00370 [Embleya sp. NBC_00888]|nr:hypothetical protein OG948_00370 [Embleya sp. NBC_00888]